MRSLQRARIANIHSRLWLALRFSDLPLNVLGFDSQSEHAKVVIEKQRVIGSNACADAAGIVFGMDVTTATLLSGCESYTRDRELERQALAQLSEQLYQFTPYIETYFCETRPHAGLLLEVSSCLKLFSGIQALSSQIIQYLQNTFFSVAIGLAHTAKGAWLLSFEKYEITGDENKTIFCERLKQLPVQLLYDYPKVVEGLTKTGFDTLGDIARQIDAQSISSMKKRFGADFATSICDIFGIEQDFQQSSLFEKPAMIYQPKETFIEILQFDYPINQLDQLQWPMETLLQKLSDYLRKRQLQCQHIEWTLADIYHNKENVNVYADTAQREGRLFYQLTHIQLEQRPLPFDVDTVELRCIHTAPIQNRSQLLDFNQTKRADRRSHDFATTAAKLKARLGNAAIFKLSYCDSHFPEVSNIAIPLQEKSTQLLPTLHSVAVRPTWLFAEPALIETRKQGLYWRGHLELLLGPERIQGNWWKIPMARDYFLAQRHDNVRLWIFLDIHTKQWYVHGVFG